MLQSGKATVMPSGNGLGPGLQGPGDEMNVHPQLALVPHRYSHRRWKQDREATGAKLWGHTPGTSGPAFILVCDCGHVPPGLSLLLPVHGQWMDTRRREGRGRHLVVDGKHRRLGRLDESPGSQRCVFHP